MSSSGLLGLFLRRSISTTACREGKRNFRKFMLVNKRGTKASKEAMRNNIDHDRRGVRNTGYYKNGIFYHVDEMVPELIVPDLSKTDLKPYVSYRVADVVQTEFTAQQLFDAIYSEKIINDFKEGKLDANGTPLQLSEEEKLTPEQAKEQSLKTGSEIFG